eukprot:330236-Chlamydomonas_euryale.AAC.2
MRGGDVHGKCDLSDTRDDSCTWMDAALIRACPRHAPPCPTSPPHTHAPVCSARPSPTACVRVPKHARPCRVLRPPSQPPPQPR